VDFVAERGICLIWTLDFVNFGGFRGFRLLAGPSKNHWGYVGQERDMSVRHDETRYLQPAMQY